MLVGAANPKAQSQQPTRIEEPLMLDASNDLFRSELLERRDRLDRALARTRGDAHLVGLLSEVDAALERIDVGTYGFCETCHESIERDRLVADPLLRYCLDHLTPGEQRALEQDLQLAAEIQRGLLPKRDVKIDGWEVSHHFAPLGPVSGDYCDVVLPDGTGEDVHFLLGDVSGKGVAASILMANLHATFRTLLATRMPIDALLERANRLFCESTIASQYATLVCTKASPGGDIEVVNAGHCPALVHHDGRTHVLQSGGLPLGMFCSSTYPIERWHLDPGDVMLLYTDGVVEARNAEDDEYGQERLLAMFDGFEDAVRRDTRKMTEGCLAHLTAFLGGRPRHDDVTVMAIRRA
jgi:sigma-B regulation protein RsbU (phosphoserine phosphatase)